jgi:hypothetical protein
MSTLSITELSHRSRSDNLVIIRRLIVVLVIIGRRIILVVPSAGGLLSSYSARHENVNARLKIFNVLNNSFRRMNPRKAIEEEVW